MINNFTNINKTNSHLWPQIIKHIKDHDICWGVNRLIGSQPPHPHLDNWGAWVAQRVRSLDLTTHTCLSPIRLGFAPTFVNCKKGCTRLATAIDKAYQLLAQGRWFSPGTPASSTNKTGRHDIAEILLKVALNTNIHSFLIIGSPKAK